VIPEAAKPVFLVDAYSDPVVVRIEGRASFLNSASLRDFVTQILKSGKSRFVIDFLRCTSMDSTFLGVLAGFALELRKVVPKGSLVLTRMGQRNLELIRNLGLHKLIVIDSGEAGSAADACATPLDQAAKGELENARLVLEAHENLVSADETNRGKFQDVLVFMKNRVEKG
ncbi:MAG: STAS domain-containing protein, partial [Gaiellaceae bacterium]